MTAESTQNYHDNFDHSKLLYEKTIKCPICGEESKNIAIKKGGYRILDQDSDFMVNYSGINPLFYEIKHCKVCGYAALPSLFDSIREKEKELIQQKITAKWTPPTYPKQYDVEFAIKQFQLALLNCLAKDGHASEKGFICLKLSWLFRIKKDEINEQRFQLQALTCLEEAYINEKTPFMGLDESSLLYLIGELHRRLGNNEKALLNFSQVLVSSQATTKIKEKVRSQRDLIRGA